jgi:hypothetical protein
MVCVRVSWSDRALDAERGPRGRGQEAVIQKHEDTRSVSL